jgi:hypothetical protein
VVEQRLVTQNFDLGEDSGEHGRIAGFPGAVELEFGVLHDNQLGLVGAARRGVFVPLGYSEKRALADLGRVEQPCPAGCGTGGFQLGSAGMQISTVNNTIYATATLTKSITSTLINSITSTATKDVTVKVTVPTTLTATTRVTVFQPVTTRLVSTKTVTQTIFVVRETVILTSTTVVGFRGREQQGHSASSISA